MADIKETSDVTPTTKAKKFNWDEDDIEKLIDLYEARPCLWDIADPTYSRTTFSFFIIIIQQQKYCQAGCCFVLRHPFRTIVKKQMNGHLHMLVTSYLTKKLSKQTGPTCWSDLLVEMLANMLSGLRPPL